MASFTITFADAIRPRLEDALCARGGWRSLALDGPRPAFALATHRKLLKELVQDHELNQAITTAAAAAKASVDTDIVIT